MMLFKSSSLCRFLGTVRVERVSRLDEDDKFNKMTSSDEATTIWIHYRGGKYVRNVL